MTPDELRKLADDPHFPNPGFWHDRLLAAADAWEAAIRERDEYRRRMIERMEVNATLRKRLEAAERAELAAAREWRGMATVEDKQILNDAAGRQREGELAALAKEEA
jgi:hypothetical protein